MSVAATPALFAAPGMALTSSAPLMIESVTIKREDVSQNASDSSTAIAEITRQGAQSGAAPEAPKAKRSGGVRKQRVTNTERIFACPKCPLKFRERAKLTRHDLVHSGVRKFECPHCDKQFALNANLKTHMLIHTGVKPFSCDVPGCPQRFTQASNRNVHVERHRLKAALAAKQAASNGSTDAMTLLRAKQTPLKSTKSAPSSSKASAPTLPSPSPDRKSPELLAPPSMSPPHGPAPSYATRFYLEGSSVLSEEDPSNVAGRLVSPTPLLAFPNSYNLPYQVVGNVGSASLETSTGLEQQTHHNRLYQSNQQLGSFGPGSPLIYAQIPLASEFSNYIPGFAGCGYELESASLNEPVSDFRLGLDQSSGVSDGFLGAQNTPDNYVSNAYGDLKFYA